MKRFLILLIAFIVFLNVVMFIIAGIMAALGVNVGPVELALFLLVAISISIFGTKKVARRLDQAEKEPPTYG
ncbi:hypothetical protein [Corynebacterium spheniscorum]|uniref:Uncharacterized protein n=1 Tax=Corynebacterium spheniscorum TaxID=185761 RepID=A0A1I2U9X2_9CORY|nr:hypothetical protein [Corynebacterium spheniscorum]KAA8720785.1 hypothetical protein F4V56_07535 [Corynebacterium spheniscorum]SFG73900.1 hypothetical protein SAMN05660282_01796 [Corynebacterium spheniscorum]